MARSRHKGATPVDKAKFYIPYGPGHPVEDMIRTGSDWFYAWHSQNGFNLDRLAKVTGIAMGRINALSRGDVVRESEVSALAAAYGVQPSDIIASLPGPEHLVRGK
ncbi:helix-turn-helix domain-containing protein [Sphingobium ummariense]|uniref:HTH cro/C1-type domain-containing protein n=1 Tax=Sphingobium ummariense RL-3 TaxID=1346791 RepID=T0J588_9SPHN|nr:helix-turn-helix transcriptional regulator [Sphingobium ummariense]EQB32002.1 hypothetical protein M529_11700 [Sphingobium ummariense RL-3]